MKYVIKHFTATESPTKYVKNEKGQEYAVGTETEREYATYAECITELGVISRMLVAAKTLRDKVRGHPHDAISLIKPPGKIWNSYKMHSLVKRENNGEPLLLHFIDNNYPTFPLVSSSDE